MHAAPDSNARLKNELEFTQDAKNAGYKALLFKSNDFSCHDRAYLIWRMTYDQIKQCMELGAWIEYSYITNLWGPGTGLPDFSRMSDETFADFTRINPERSFVTTDLGQPGMPHPIEGMRGCIKTLHFNGLSKKQIELLVKDNPCKLLGLTC